MIIGRDDLTTVNFLTKISPLFTPMVRGELIFLLYSSFSLFLYRKLTLYQFIPSKIKTVSMSVSSRSGTDCPFTEAWTSEHYCPLRCS